MQSSRIPPSSQQDKLLSSLLATNGTATHKPNNEVLLKECELCTNDANHLEQMIWTTAGILFTASVAGIGLLGSSMPQNLRPYDFVTRICLSFLSIVFIWMWRTIALRWYAIQKIMYYRVVELEVNLTMYKERYVLFLDNAVEGKDQETDKNFRQIASILKSRHKPGGVRQTVSLSGIILILVWFTFALSQLGAMLGWL